MLQATIIVLGLVSRKIFIWILGEEYLGLNGLFTNILSLLDMAELGVATSIIYSLYIPLAYDDKPQIIKLMNFYKKCYRIIAAIIFVLGISVLPFLGEIVGKTTFANDYIQITYVLFLIMTVSSYFFSYKRSLVYADQKNYKLMHVDIFFKFLIFIVANISLYLFKDYMIYLFVTMIVSIFNNYVIAKYVDKLYPFLAANLKLEAKEIRPIISNIKNIFIHKVAGTIISSTDNIIISIFLGIVQVGIYSNYSMIVVSLQGFLNKVLNACQASIGNLLMLETTEKVEETLQNMTLLSFFLTSLCTVSLFCLTNDLITFWLGEKFLLGLPIVGVCAVNFFASNIKNPLYQFVNVSGLFKEDRNNAIIGAVLNIGFTLVFVKEYGLFGVFFGAFLASLITLVLKSCFFYKKFLHKSASCFLLSMAVFFLILFIEMFLCEYLCGIVTFSNMAILFVSKCLVCFLLPSLINYIVFHNTKEYQYLMGIAGSIVLKFTHRLNRKDHLHNPTF